MANKVFAAAGLTGGDFGALDAIKVTTDGVTVGDMAVAGYLEGIDPGTPYICFFVFVTGVSPAEEDEPDTIIPDEYSDGVAYTGNGFWMRVDPFIGGGQEPPPEPQ